MKVENVIELIQAVSSSELNTFQYQEGEVKLMMGRGIKEDLLFRENLNSGIFDTMNGGAQNSASSNTEIAHENAKGVVEGSPQLKEALEEVAITAEKEQVGKEEVSGAKDQEQSFQTVNSPLVGIFYSAPAEGATPFVKKGDHVSVGQTLAIVEAMKLMNEITSEYDGVIEEVLVKDGEAIEYNQPLFRIQE